MRIARPLALVVLLAACAALAATAGRGRMGRAAGDGADDRRRDRPGHRGLSCAAASSAAAERDARLVVLQMDTPGGLDTSMRDIIKAILASPVPVAAFVAPERRARGERGHVHPLCEPHRGDGARHQSRRGHAGAIGGGRRGAEGRDKARGQARKPPTRWTRKAINDAAAYIRGLAQLRGRNADWAETGGARGARACRRSEALDAGVIDHRRRRSSRPAEAARRPRQSR